MFTIAHNVLSQNLCRRWVKAKAGARLGITEAPGFGDEELERVKLLTTGAGSLTEPLETLPRDQAEAIRARVIHNRVSRGCGCARLSRAAENAGQA